VRRILRILGLAVLISGGASHAHGEGATYRLWADEVGYSAPQEAMASGRVRLSYEQVEIFADRLLWDVARRQVRASGNVKIVSEERSLAGDSLSLDLEKETGEMVPATGRVRDLFLSAERIEMFPDRLSAYEAKMTTCDEEPPHYQIQTKKADIYLVRREGKVAAQHLEARRAALEYGDRRLLSLPPFRVSLGEEPEAERSLPLPYPSYGRLDGPFLGYRWRKGWPMEKLSLDVEWRITERRGTRAGVYARYLLGGEDFLQLAASRREDLRDRPLGPRDIDTGLAKVLVSREPELSLQVGPRFARKGLRWEVQGTVGNLREWPTGVSTRRVAATGRLLVGPLRAGERLKIGGAAAYRFSSYGEGSQAGVLYGRLTLSSTLARESHVSLSLVARNSSGSTPFRFDRVEMARELASEFAFPPAKRWRVKLLNRFDLQQRRSRDTGVELTYRAHCLNYSLGWKQNRGLFEFSIGLAERESNRGSLSGSGSIP